MKFNKNILFILLIVFLLSLNFAVAKDLNETNVNSESFEIDYDNSISISDANYQDDSNQMNSVHSTESSNKSTEIISKENSNEHNLLNDIDNYNHVYVSPDGSDDGSSPNAPGNFIDILYEVDEGTVIHMLDGIYTLNAGDELYPEDLNNVMIIADNPGKVTIDSQIYPTGKFTETSVFYFTNCDLKFENIIFSSTLVENQGNYNHIWGYFVFGEGNYIFEDCKFINTYSACLMYLTEDFDNKVKINNCSFINNNILNDDSDEILGLIRICSGDLTLENIICDKSYNIYYPFEDSGVFSSHATLTFLDGEESVTVGENSNLIINASLVDDYGNIIILPNIKCTIFEQERTLSYSNGVYQTTITTPDILDTYNIDGVDDFIDTYLSDCTIIKPDIVVKHSHNITLNTSDIMYGESANVNITVSNIESGNISYTVKSGNNIIKEEVNKEFSNNSVSIVLPNLDAGTYTVTATVLATEGYGETTVSKTLIVNKNPKPITLSVNSVFSIVDNITFNVNVAEGVTGTLTLKLANNNGNAHQAVDLNVNGVDFNYTFNPVNPDSIYQGVRDDYEIWFQFKSSSSNYADQTVSWKSYTYQFSVVRLNSNLTVKADNVDWGNNLSVFVNTDSRFTGNITVKVGDEEKIAEIKDGSGNVSFANLKANTYNVTAKFNETNLFTASQKDINVTVNKVNATLTLGDDIVFDWNKTGSTSVSYSGATDVEAVIVETGAVVPIQGNTITVSNLKADTYTLRVTATPDENHTQTTKTISIKVNKVNSTLTLGDDITFDYGNSSSTTVSYTGATNVEAVVVGHQASVVTKDGIITVSNLDAGDYILNVTTQVDENHTSISKTVNIKVNKVDSDINILNPVNYVYGNVGQCSVFSQGVINFTAVIVDHPEANITIDNGIVNVSGLKVGNYTLRVTANPDRNHNSVFRECNVTVNMAEVPADQALNITVPADSHSPTFSINLDSSAEGNFTVYVDGKEWSTVKVVNGSASITVANLPAGNHNITISYSGDDNHAAIVQNTTLSISKIATGISASKVTAVYLTSKKLVVTLKDKAGNILTGMKVTVKVGSISKTLTTDSKGQVSVDVSKLVPKTYTAKFTFAGDDKYLKSEGSASVKINKAASKITAKKKTFKAKKKTKKYTITLKSGKKAIGKVKVTIKVGKKTYTAKTNKKGKATFNLKKLTKKGKYNAVIKFKGNKYYKATTKKVKIVLK